MSILQEQMEGKPSKGMGKMSLLQPDGPTNGSENQEIAGHVRAHIQKIRL